MSSYIYENNNTKAFYALAWIAFCISFIGMAVGLVTLEAAFAVKGFLGMSYLFSVTACFVVAKVVRDKHESDRFINKVEHAKTEKFLSEHVDPVRG
ncbi:YiaA/YiaB family inner membrane protein [Flavilitoribacter nigricans]|uniref:YiaAB two helix domain-containing protein n=1 Tax=Flavilitoribacter nigricans (strain ATCC 23147 / DSM 23189 / NBRC 102662 / NCIMB 1420 / SS-2) TaxID=1122177 RepID=A0A2D0MXM6_FLAN2|nr:YiaA/YiaB family inner membrane protein [Flavilitoribacter nigricans]PHN01031.1 hypothetical protein CRP01_39185 [Flavilitoribacter nigricans DSM 23189 = NBRC 102662]